MDLAAILKSLWNPTAELVAAGQQRQTRQEASETLLRRLQFRMKHRLGSPYPGNIRGIFKGHGIDLKGLREYQPGDEIRKMDWNVLARTGVPHIKEHYEEKEVPVWAFVDGTAPMYFGQVQSKLAYAGMLVGVLGLLALENGHKVGLVYWQGDAVPRVIQPGSSLTQLQWIVQEIGTAEQCAEAPKPATAFPDLSRVFYHRGLVLLLSDFQFLRTCPDVLPLMSRLSRRHQVHSLLLVDPVEEDLVYGHGWLPVTNDETRRPYWINTQERWRIKAYRRAFRKQIQVIQQQLRPWSSSLLLHTHEDPVVAIVRFINAMAS